MIMNLGKLGENQFSLHIVDYQFPDNRANDYDANWLLIEIIVTTPNDQWQKTAPALLTWEVQSLISWLEAVNIDREDWNCINFLEPNLSFCLKGRDDDNVVLGVHLALEFKPSRELSHETIVEIDCTHEELSAWIMDLKVQLAQFPIQLTFHDEI